MKTFSFSKKNFFFIIFSNFINVQKFLIFCQKSLIVRAEINFLEIIPFDLHSTANLLFLSFLKKTQDFFSRKTHLFSKKGPKFWTFREISLIQSHSTENFRSVAIIKKLNFFRKTHLFFLKKTQILNVLRNLTILVPFYGLFKFATIWWKK